MKTVKTILIGTSEFAERIFRKIYPAMRDKFEIIAVVTAEDKPIGRKQILTPPPIKKWAAENNLPVLQPEKISAPEWIKKIKELNPDLIILVAYGQIIPKEILDIPEYKALNIHPSLLPKYRGASPIQAAILNGDRETGVTIMLMDEKMDHGPILASAKLQIPASPAGRPNSQTYQELSEKLANLGAELLIKILPDWIKGKIKSQEQDHSKATFCKIIKKEDGKIDWNKSAEEIERQIRAFQEWPGSYTDFNGKILKITEADYENLSTMLGASTKIGEVFIADKKELGVQTRNGILILKRIQLEGKKPMPVKDFLNGHPEIVGAILR